MGKFKKLAGLVAGVLLMAGSAVAVHAANSATTATPCSTDVVLASGFATNGAAFPAQLYKDVSGSCAGTKFAGAHVPVDSNGNATNGFQHVTTQNLGDSRSGTLGNLQVKTTAGVLGGLHLDNQNGSSAFVQCFDAQSANITMGTTKPDFQWKVATVTTVDVMIPGGLTFGTALTCYSSTADSGGTTSGSGVHVSAFYN